MAPKVSKPKARKSNARKSPPAAPSGEKRFIAVQGEGEYHGTQFKTLAGARREAAADAKIIGPNPSPMFVGEVLGPDHEGFNVEWFDWTNEGAGQGTIQVLRTYRVRVVEVVPNAAAAADPEPLAVVN